MGGIGQESITSPLVAVVYWVLGLGFSLVAGVGMSPLHLEAQLFSLP